MACSFARSSSALLISASFCAAGTSAAPSADVYGAAPEVQQPVVSPDGRHLAMVVPSGDQRAVHILKIGGARCSFSSGTTKLRDIFWANADRLVARVSFTFAADPAARDTRYTYEIYRAISVDTNCQGTKELLSDLRGLGNITGFDFVGRAPDGKNLLVAALNVQAPAKMVDTRLKGVQLTSYDVFLVDASTGKSEKFETGSNRTIEWFADATGQLPLRLEKEENSGRITAQARIGGSKDWQTVYDSAAVSDPSRSLSFLAVGNRPDTAYVTTRNGGDKYGIYEFDFNTKGISRQVFQSQRVDADRLLFDGYSQQAVGVSYINDLPTAEYFDRGYAQMQADLAATFPGERVQVLSVSADRQKFVAYVEGAQNPGGVYHYVDMTIPDMSKIGARYSALSAADIASVTSFTYQARDGMTIPSYLTLPPGSAGKNLPLIVMPHGGPAARDDASFDPWAQFLATRGYAVLQPQFRGSDGFGFRHRDAGHHKWGLEMQHDITDGVKYLIANGTVDAAKVCIYGWSYGGYAAMAGLAFTPDLYKCGASGAGPSDLLLLVGDAARRADSVHLGGKTWREWLGDPTQDRERLLATSPARHAGNIKAPLLLIHGKDDTVVAHRHSLVMSDAMKSAGKPVELITIEGDDHWLSRASTSKRVLRELERFLGQNLK
jgi:dipeptidyl aminopeptidase/acylaminoacyl peptidase